MIEAEKTKNYYTEDYLPMRKREQTEISNNVMKDIKLYARTLKGFNRKKKISEYSKQRMQELYNISWDIELDIFAGIYISFSLLKTGKGNIEMTINGSGDIIDFETKGDTKRGWETIKEKSYNHYLQYHKDNIETKEVVLKIILKEIEDRTPLILNLMKDKPRTRGIPAKMRYTVYMRDKGVCVVCGSNKNIEFDHVIPYSKGGAHSVDNLRVLCETCNRKKGDKDISSSSGLF